MDKILLNPPQQEAVEHVEGPLLILAGAGSGKTRVITQRAVHLINDCGIKPWNILAITFTNKAAKEMRDRIDSAMESGYSDVYVSTFHSLCLRILFKYAENLGYSSQFEICDASDQKSIIKDVCKILQIDTKMFKERTLLSAISSAKDELIDPIEFANRAGADYKQKIISSVYTEYQAVLKRNNSFDFDDLIVKTVELFRKFPEVLEEYQERFKFIMVDEYQDTNTAQFELVRLLARKYRNLCVVGDDDQSIYRFRGANISNILNFEKYYEDAKVIRLEQNYRSTQNILDAANEVIQNNVGRKAKRLWTDKEEGDKIHYKQLDNAASEAMYIAEDIKKKVAAGRFKYGDCAILMRTNVQSKEFEDAFRVLRIDYDLVKGLRFWDTKVIKDLTSYILTVASGSNDMRTTRIINVPKRGIGNASIDKIQTYALANNISFFEACEAADQVPGLGKAAAKVLDFAGMIQRIRSRLEFMDYGELIENVLDETEYMDYLSSEADTEEKYTEMCEYIEKLKEALMDYEQKTEEPDLVDFMRQNGVEGNNINSSINGGVIQKDLTEEEERELREKKVLIMTMHNAKGLEFPNVYLAGMEDGLFPSYMTITNDDGEEMEEERRLCYVAITRAKENLTITSARSRMVNGETRYSKTSRFVKEIPFGLLDMNLPKEIPSYDEQQYGRVRVAPGFGIGGGSVNNYSRAVKRGSDDFSYSRFDADKVSDSSQKVSDRPVSAQTPGGQYGSLDPGYGRVKAVPKRKPDNLGYMKGAAIASLEKPSYEVGDRVQHIRFGIGTVLELKSGGRDYEVLVNFDNVGQKRMFASFAKLKKV